MAKIKSNLFYNDLKYIYDILCNIHTREPLKFDYKTINNFIHAY